MTTTRNPEAGPSGAPKTSSKAAAKRVTTTRNPEAGPSGAPRKIKIKLAKKATPTQNPSAASSSTAITLASSSSVVPLTRTSQPLTRPGNTSAASSLTTIQKPSATGAGPLRIEKISETSLSQATGPTSSSTQRRYKYFELAALFNSDVRMIGTRLVIYDGITHDELSNQLKVKKNKSKTKKSLFTNIPESAETRAMDFSLEELMNALNARVIVHNEGRLWMIHQTSVTCSMLATELIKLKEAKHGLKTDLFNRLFNLQ